MAEQGLVAPVADAGAARRLEAEKKLYFASQWRLIWWRFRRNKVALVSGIMVALIYLVAIFAEFLAPWSSEHYNGRYTFAPPQRLHFFLETEGGTQF